MLVKNINFYSFFTPAFDIVAARDTLDTRLKLLDIKGTVLLSAEGINCSLCGAEKAVDTALQLLFDMGVPRVEIKTSFSDLIAFNRMIVKIKRWIVPNPGPLPLGPLNDPKTCLSPEKFHSWLMENKPMVLLDTRNDYEYEVGRFKCAQHLGTRHFADFNIDLNKAPARWRQLPVVTYCTGGIRCEKAVPLLLQHGFQEVYQLQDGILGYFKKIGRGFFEGRCFVFDARLSLDEQLSAPQMSA